MLIRKTNHTINTIPYSSLLETLYKQNNLYTFQHRDIPLVLLADSIICNKHRPNSSITIRSCTTGGIFIRSDSSACANKQAHVASATSLVIKVYGNLKQVKKCLYRESCMQYQHYHVKYTSLVFTTLVKKLILSGYIKNFKQHLTDLQIFYYKIQDQISNHTYCRILVIYIQI